MRLSMVIWFSFPVFLIGQQLILQEVNLTDQYVVNDMIQDENSMIWLATTKGLVYYNGFEDELIAEPNLHNPQCLHIIGRTIYIGYQNGYLAGLNMDDYSFTRRDSITDKRITDIENLNQDELLIASYGSGLYNYDLLSAAPSVSLNSTIPSPYIYQMELVNEENMLISTDNGLYEYDVTNDQVTIYDNLPDKIITHINISDSLIWASTYDRGLFSISKRNPLDIQFYPSKMNRRINDLILYNGVPFLSTEEGLFTLNKNQSSTNYYARELENKYTSLLIDVENNLWAADRNGGLGKASLYFSRLNFSFSDNIQSILKLSNTLLLGGENGLYDFNVNQKSIKQLNHYNITCLRALNNLIFFGTYNSGIFVLDQDYKELMRLDQSNGLPDNAILNFEFQGDTLIYVSTLAGIAACRLDINRMHVAISNTNSVSSFSGLDYILNLKLDSHSNLWAGKDRTGLSRLSAGNMTQYERINEKKIGSVFSIAQANRIIWFSSSNMGILKYEDDTFTQVRDLIHKDDPYTSIIPLTDDQLLLVNKAGVEMFNVGEETITRFDQEAEFKEEEPYLNNYSIYKNEIWFVHNNDVYVFMNSRGTPLRTPSTEIDRIEVNIDPVGSDEKIFSQRQNNFKFNFSGRWFTDPSKLHYGYQLAGHDEGWRLTKDRTAIYPKLPPGEYTFKVKSTINTHFTNEKETTYSFRINRAFVNSIWFYLLLAGSIFYIAYRWNKQIQDEKFLKASLQKNQIETQLINLKAQLNPHFLFNSFNTLSGLIDESVSASKTFIENLSDFYRLMLEVGDEQLIPLSKELSILKAYKHLLKERFRNGFELKINHDTHNQANYIPPLVLQMLVENALKHNQVSQSNPLIISMRIKEDSIEVKNNLIPKNFASSSTGFGLKNIISRFKILGLGDVVVQESDKYFCVLIPLAKNI